MTEGHATKVGGDGEEGKRQLMTAEERRYDIRIARDGTWFHEGGPIRRIELVKLFASVLRRDDAGDFWLVTPAERGRILVEDAPFQAVEMTARGEGRDQILAFRTNVDDWVEAGPDHPIRVDVHPATGEPSPYIEIRQGLEARIARSVFYDLVDRAVPNSPDREAEIGVWSRRVFFVLGRQPGA
ncbi:DUF1285 domain-containing protein [Azospirillum sp. RWY-5-1]|uniref:DUF1285 domain-containing protein n=1 Tax=Azospirillum oleiclasticum TaxID=2735135 RepID=A0ABX2T585_9PROT|nr:DUF1285 domain-containing protein [Azospirillum oleiclasticum]NYZ19000.1 DUF1285 domain-containing protein [Azospirillum oleiclasticum]